MITGIGTLRSLVKATPMIIPGTMRMMMKMMITIIATTPIATGGITMMTTAAVTGVITGSVMAASATTTGIMIITGDAAQDVITHQTVTVPTAMVVKIPAVHTTG